VFGLAYSYGLGKYVETLGGSAEDAGAVQGAGVGQARFAFLILLFVIVGKFRTQGLQEIPAIMGFFTYQLASLNQGEVSRVLKVVSVSIVRSFLVAYHACLPRDDRSERVQRLVEAVTNMHCCQSRCTFVCCASSPTPFDLWLASRTVPIVNVRLASTPFFTQIYALEIM